MRLSRIEIRRFQMFALSIKSIADFVTLMGNTGKSLPGETEPLCAWLEQHGCFAELVPFARPSNAASAERKKEEASHRPALIAALPGDCVITDTVGVCPFPVGRMGFMRDTLGSSYYEAYVFEPEKTMYRLTSRVLSFLPATSVFWSGLSAIHATACARASVASPWLSPEEYQANLPRSAHAANEAYLLLARIINAKMRGGLFDLMNMMRDSGVDACAEFLDREVGRMLPDTHDISMRRTLLRHIAEAHIDPDETLTLFTM